MPGAVRRCGIIAALALVACPPAPEPDEPPPGPEPSPEVVPAWDDDDVDLSAQPPPNRPPRVEVVGREPEDDAPVPEQLVVDLRVSDPDSVEVSVTITRFNLDGLEVGATLEGTNSSAIDLQSDAPLDDEPAQVVWLSGADLAEGGEVFLRFCPVDAQGNPGTCVGLPPPPPEPVNPPLFCQAGAARRMSWTGGQALLPLALDQTGGGFCASYEQSDPPDPADFAARFLLVLVNPHASPVTLSVTTTSPDPVPALAVPELEPPPAPGTPAGPSSCEHQVFLDDIGTHAVSYALRSSLAEGAVRTVHGATLQGLGDRVAVYVDDATPFVFDPDCEDDTNPIESSDLPAEPFTTCDLGELVDVLDVNVVPNVTDHFGPLSDVDGDCRLDVVVSHRLNQLTGASDEPQHQGVLVTALAEPGADLVASSFAAPSSEREILALASPDPLGLWSDVPLPVDGWTQAVAPGAASELYRIVSFANHRGLTDLGPDPAWGPPQEDWLEDGLALLAADLCGFGQAHHEQVWRYLDATDLVGLTTIDDPFGFEDRGAQYLFARWLYDLFGTQNWPLHPVSGNDLRGVDQLAARTGMGFDKLALLWAGAMGVTGRLNVVGAQLVPDLSIPNFQEPSFAPVTGPWPNALLGAEGFQLGFDVLGANLQHLPTDPPGSPSGMVRTTGPDPRVFHPQTDLYATVAGEHGVLMIEVAGLAQPENVLRITTAGGEDLEGLVVRLNDENPHDRALLLEQVPGALLTEQTRLHAEWSSLDEALIWQGLERRVIGAIEAAESVELAEGGSTEVADIDRYSFTTAGVQELAVEVTRRADQPDGTPSLTDPFVALVPASDLPDALDYSWWGVGSSAADGPCSDPSLFDYPVVMPGFVAAQANLLPDPVDGPWEPALGSGGPLPCDIDLDQDGLPDDDEPAPPHLAAQIRLRQAENLALDPTGYQGFGLLWEEDTSVPFWDHRFIDLDSNEQPDDELPATSMELGVGGRAWAEGEDALLVQLLPPGDYVLLVGSADDSTGAYDLSVRLVQ